jgi:hypothetical protein
MCRLENKQRAALAFGFAIDLDQRGLGPRSFMQLAYLSEALRPMFLSLLVLVLLITLFLVLRRARRFRRAGHPPGRPTRGPQASLTWRSTSSSHY